MSKAFAEIRPSQVGFGTKECQRVYQTFGGFD